MKVTRSGVFETNSSSMHSVSFPKTRDGRGNIELPELDDNEMFIPLGQFGWGLESYSDWRTKLSYLITMAMEISSDAMVHAIDRENVPYKDWPRMTSSEVENALNSVLNDDDFAPLYKEEYYRDFIDIAHMLKSVMPNLFRVRIEDTTDWYVDHQSYTQYNTIHNFIDDYSTTMEAFVFNPRIVLIIDNDNH